VVKISEIFKPIFVALGLVDEPEALLLDLTVALSKVHEVGLADSYSRLQPVQNLFFDKRVHFLRAVVILFPHFVYER
jgi:hypothetical protein